MKNTTYSPPEEFVHSPLLSLLPVAGTIGELERIRSSLYARYEKVTAIKKNLLDSGERQSDLPARVKHEEEMLRHVLEWLSVKLD